MIFNRKTNKLIGKYSIQKLPYFRRIFIDSLDALAPSRNMLGLLELDVTTARKKISKAKWRKNFITGIYHKIHSCCRK